MISTYLRLREKTKQYVPFAPPIPSPKNTDPLDAKQKAHYLLWRGLMKIPPQQFANIFKSEKPIFLIGCHNSGTTILARLIGQHPDIINWSEAPDVWTPDDWFLNWDVMSNPPLPKPFIFDPLAYERTVEDHGEYMATIRQVFDLYAFTRRKKRFMNKNPHMCLSIPYIEAIYPDAHYIYIRRNGYAVAQSLLGNWRKALQQVTENPNSGWGKLKGAIDDIYFDDPLALVRQCADYWQLLDQKSMQDLNAITDRSRIYETTYEDICDHPEQILRDVFLQMDLSADCYDWQQLHNPTRYPWTDMLPMENRNFKYRERLTVEEIQAITDTAHDLLAECGYLHTDE